MPQSILIEGHNLALTAGTGIATYARNLSRTLRELGYKTDVLLSTKRAIDAKDPLLGEVGLHDALADLPPPLLIRAVLEIHKLIGTPLGIRPIEVRRTGAVIEPGRDKFDGFNALYTVPHLLDLTRFHFKRYGRPSLLHLDTAPALFHATHPIPIRVRNCPNVFTIHDLVPLRLPYTTLDDKKFFLNMLREIAKRADHIVTVSEHSRRDIMQFLEVGPDRITNTYQSVHIPQSLLNKSEDAVATELSASFELGFREYFLFVGAIEPKKNISRLIDAYASSGTKWPLIVVGAPGWQFENDLERISDRRFDYYEVADGNIRPRRRIQHLRYLPFSQLIALLRGARGVLFPSLYEGFGLPVLEAMLAGSPVLTSNVSSLPEVAADAALLVDPYDTEDMATNIRRLDQDAGLRETLIAKGRLRAHDFSPQHYCERVSALYRRLIG